MKINVRSVQGVTVIEPIGELSALTAPVALEQILSAGNKVVLDMAQVPIIFTAGLRALLLGYRAVGGAGGRIVLAGTVPLVLDTLMVTGFLDFLPNFASIEAAVNELASGLSLPPLIPASGAAPSPG